MSLGQARTNGMSCRAQRAHNLSVTVPQRGPYKGKPLQGDRIHSAGADLPGQPLHWCDGEGGAIGFVAGKATLVEQATVEADRKMIHAKRPGVKGNLLPLPAHAIALLHERRLIRTCSIAEA